MMITKLFYYLLIIIHLGMGCKSIANKETNSTINPDVGFSVSDTIETLPLIIKNYISDSLANYQSLNITDYIQEWYEFTNENKLPYICSSDFNGDNKSDYAILLKQNTKEIHLIAIMTVANSLSHSLIYNYGIKNDIDIFLSIVEKGEWQLINESVIIPNDAIGVLMAKESIEYAFFWNGDNWIKVLAD